jgi:serine/threonine protein phosphatase PrpC
MSMPALMKSLRNEGRRAVAEPSAGLRYRSASATHAGAVRTLNEDAFLDNPASGLWAVADGVGGHAAGDYASQALVGALGRIAPQASAMDLLEAVRGQLEVVNDNLCAYAANEGVDITATTVAVLLCFGHHYAAVWAGDSRIYLLRDSQLHLLTRDHTAVQELVDAGAITPQEALRHPRRNVVTRAVGAAATLELEMTQDRLEPNDIFLLCSDGLGKVVTDDEIGATLASASFEELPRLLIERVLDRGGPDNVTIVLVGCLAKES